MQTISLHIQGYRLFLLSMCRSYILKTRTEDISFNTLHLRNVQVGDTGMYECRAEVVDDSTLPTRKVRLIVIRKSDYIFVSTTKAHHIRIVLRSKAT